eukprot:scaffold135452_cov32-Tisochrysis_lutea.AAC.4
MHERKGCAHIHIGSEGKTTSKGSNATDVGDPRCRISGDNVRPWQDGHWRCEKTCRGSAQPCNHPLRWRTPSGDSARSTSHVVDVSPSAPPAVPRAAMASLE